MGILKRHRIIYRIFLGVGVSVLVVLLGIGFLAYKSVEDEIVEEFDSQMVTSATVLWSLSRGTPATSTVVLDDARLPLPQSDQKALREYAKWRSYRVWRGGQLLRATANAPNSTQGPNDVGFANLVTPTERWRVYTLVVPQDQMTIEVSEKLTAREKLTAHVVRDLVLPLLWAFPLVLLVVFFGTRWGLRDLDAFAARIKSRSANDLTVLDTQHLPSELLSVATALNDLFGRLTVSYEQGRIFTDNAAHELRTPLAALSLQAEVLTRANSQEERDELLQELRAGVSRASRMLEQLLTIARLQNAPLTAERFNVYHLAQVILSDMYPIAGARKVVLSLQGAENAEIVSSSDLLTVLLRNLIDNAVKHAPANSEVAVVVSPSELTITDQGSGIPEQERHLVFGRFYRRAAEVTPGSGLGLAIVDDLAKRLGFKVSLHDGMNGKGLTAKVSWAEVPL
jgi:signal transduction histidine kinase